MKKKTTLNPHFFLCDEDESGKVNEIFSNSGLSSPYIWRSKAALLMLGTNKNDVFSALLL